MKLKIFSLLLCVAVLVGTLSGCVGSEIRDYSDQEETEDSNVSYDSSGDVDVTADVSTGEGETTETKDYTYAFEAYDPDMLVMTVDGVPVYWSEYFYWLLSTVGSLEYYYGEIADWDAKAMNYTCDCETPGECGECMSNRELVENSALDVIKQYKALEFHSNDLGVGLTEEDNVNLEALWTEDVQTYGGGDEEAFAEYMDSIFLTRDLYDYINKVACLYYNTFNYMYGSSGELCSDEDIMDFAENNNYIMAKHILFSTVDDEGEALPEEDIAEKRALAEDVLSQLQACESNEDLESLFDELMNENSEDTGLAYYPEGYCFTQGDMVEEFESTAMALGEYELSGIVETDYGYHIILRLPLEPDAVVEYYSEEEQYDLRYIAAVAMYESLVQSWMDEAELVYSDEFANFDIAEVF